MNITECPNPSCQKPLKETALFCGKCKTQVKCLDCKELLSIEDECCEACGKDVLRKSTSSGAVNKLRIQETIDGRFIEAEFTDPAAKGLMDTLGNFLIAKQLSLNPVHTANNSDFSTLNSSSNLDESIDAEIVNDTTARVQNSTQPTLETVVMKNLPDSETEWIIVYAFYKSDFGKKIFTRQDIIDSYQQTKRKNVSRINNLSKNIKSAVSSDFMNLLSDNQFTLLDHGVKKALEIISRTTGTSTKSKSTKKASESVTASKQVKKTGKAAAKAISQEEFDVASKGKTLKQFYSENDPGSVTNSRILMIAYYIIKYVKQNNFSDGNIDFAYRALGLDKRPRHLRQTIVNMKNQHAWVAEDGSTGNWVLSRNGEIHIEEELLKVKK